MTKSVPARQLTAVAAAYSLATTPFNIAPLLVSAVITVLGSNEERSGQLMTLELLSMSVIAMVATPLGQWVRQPAVLISAALLVMLVHGLSALADSYPVLLSLRVLAGVGAGVLLLAVNTTIAASSDPVRLYGAGAVASTGVGLVLLFLMPSLIANQGLIGAYAPLAVVALLTLCVVRWMGVTASVSRVAGAEEKQQGIPVSPFNIGLLLIALFAIQFTQAALYAFSERMGVIHAGLSQEDMGLVLAVGYTAAMGASALASWLSYRLGRYLPLLLGFAVYGLGALTMAITDNGQLFAAGFMVLTFGYFFVLPYQLGIPADLDHSGKLSGLGVGIIFIGLSCGAYFGGLLVAYSGYPSLGFVAATAAAAGLALLLFVIRRS